MSPLAFVHDTGYDDLPEAARAWARRCLLDLAGVAAAGRTTRLSRLIRDHAAGQFGAGESAAVLLLDGRRVSPAGAALAGGMTIDAFDAHDGHRLTKGHAGCGVLPALLALTDAEGPGGDGGAFLAALVVGYEVAIRAGIGLHRTVPDYHTSGAWVAVACAALGARLLGLDGARTRHALGIAEYHGPRSQMMRCIDHPTMLKDGSGWGAMAGVSAAYLARDGFTGAPALTVEAPEVADLWADVGTRWRITEQYVKPYPVCRWAQPAAEAVVDLLRDHKIAAADIDRIEVATFAEAARLACREPRTTEEAQYSLPYPVAALAVRGRLGAEEVAETAFADPEIRRLSLGMVLTQDPAFDRAFPVERLARAVVRLKDGRNLRSATTRARGDPETPLDDAELQAKFDALAVPVMGAARAGRIRDAVAALPDDRALRTLREDLAAPVG